MGAPLHGNKKERDPFARLGIDLAKVEITPLRTAELERSSERVREIDAAKVRLTLTRFHLVIRDLDKDTFDFEMWFEPALAEDDAPLSAAQKLGGMVALFLDGLIAKEVGKDHFEEKSCTRK